MTAERYLAAVHRTLYPEDWMTEGERAAETDSGYLNAEGIREWSLDDLDAIAYIVRRAALDGAITPGPTTTTPKGDAA